MDYFNKDRSEIFTFDIDESTKANFHEMARWTKFLAVIGFVFLSLLILAGIFIGTLLGNSIYLSQYSSLGGAVGLAAVYIVGALLYFYPTYALLKYSTNMKAAIATNDKNRFSIAINYLKNMFKFVGIFMIIILGIYGVAIVFSIIKLM